MKLLFGSRYALQIKAASNISKKNGHKSQLDGKNSKRLSSMQKSMGFASANFVEFECNGGGLYKI